MSWAHLTPGSIIRYPYLWAREASNYETEGRKPRETAIAARFEFEGVEHLAILAITSTPPSDDIAAYELPALEVQRIERGSKNRLWIVLSEWNIDIPGDSYYLEGNCKVGDLSPAVYRELYNAFIAAIPKSKRVPRHD